MSVAPRRALCFQLPPFSLSVPPIAGEHCKRSSRQLKITCAFKPPPLCPALPPLPDPLTYAFVCVSLPLRLNREAAANPTLRLWLRGREVAANQHHQSGHSEIEIEIAFHTAAEAQFTSVHHHYNTVQQWKTIGVLAALRVRAI